MAKQGVPAADADPQIDIVMTAALHAAAPLYKERSEVVLGKKDVPIEYAQRSEEEEDQAAKPEPEAPKEDQGPVPAGIPEFWLGAMRAHPLISEHVRLLPGTASPSLAAPVMGSCGAHDSFCCRDTSRRREPRLYTG